jgi:hypothetical protein
MKRKMITVMVVCLFLVICGPANARKKEVIKVIGGTPIPSAGIVIDASYDPRFDQFVPGYKMLNVIIINNSFKINEFNGFWSNFLVRIITFDKFFKS